MAQRSTVVEVDGYDVNITAWGKDEGLLTSSISEMIEDHDGALWLVTDENTIHQFDGKKSIAITQEPRGDTLISNLRVDSLGNIWAVFSSGGSRSVFRFNPLSGLRQLDLDISTKVRNASKVELKYTGNTLYCYSFTKDSLRIYVLADAWQLAFSCHNNRFKNAWVLPTVKRKLFYKLDQTEAKLTVIDQNGLPVQEAIRFFDTHGETQTGKKNVWAWDYSSTSDVVFSWQNNQSKKKTNYTYDAEQAKFSKTDIYKDLGLLHSMVDIPRGQYIITGHKISIDGISLYNTGPLLEIFKQKLYGEEITFASRRAITRSGQNAVWLSSSVGLLRVEIRKTLFERPFKENTGPSIRSIIALIPDTTVLIYSNHVNYILDVNHKIHRANKRSPSWSTIRLTKNQFIEANERGLILKRQITDKTISTSLKTSLPSVRNSCLHLLANGNLLLGHTKGLSILNQSDLTPIAARMADTTIYCFYESPFTLWLGTNHGLYNYKTKESFAPQLNVNHIYQENESTLWLATNSGLVHLDTKTSRFQRYGLKEGLSHKKLHSVYPDNKGNLWLSSDFGLMLFNTTDRTTQTFFKADGIANNEFNRRAHFKDVNGRLFLGGMKGLTIIEPDREYANAIEPLNAIHISDIQLFNEENEPIPHEEYDYTLNEHLNIKDNTKRIEISIKHADYSSKHIRYQWRIDKGSTLWQEFDGEKITLYTPRLNEYAVEIRAFIEGNLIASTYQSQGFNVQKPFYKSGLFFFFLFLSSIGGTYLLSSYLNNRSKKKLEGLVEQKTSEIREQSNLISKQKNELEISNNELAIVNKTKSRFLTNISHDFKTPLSIILLASEKIFESRNTSSILKKYINKIQSEVENLVEETRQIHDLAKLEEGSIKPEYAKVEWQSFCKTLFARFEELSKQKSIDYSLTVEEKEPFYLSLDKVKMNHVISNVLENAFKFTPKKGSIRLHCSLENDDAVIQVIDSGPGVDESERHKIFERYYQGKAALPTEYTGTGIGLSFCKELLDVLGGSIHVASNSPSAFSIRFPKLEAAHEAAADKERILEPEPALLKTKKAFSSETIFNHHKPTLLLVEDNVKLLESLKDLLAPNYGLILAKNGRVALELLESNHNVDLIISDIMMDEVDGFTLLEKLRNNDSIYTNTPFIFISAINDMKNRMDALRLGIDGYIAKPFQSIELVAQIENLLGKQKKRREFYSKIDNAENKNQIDPFNAKPLEQVKWLKKLEELVRKKSQDNALNPQMVANEINISAATLSRRIKASTGLTPGQYIQKVRIAKALELLQNEEVFSVAEVCYKVGFKSPSHFTRLFKKEYGNLPSAYLKV